jgi:hypothetical protein
VAEDRFGDLGGEPDRRPPRDPDRPSAAELLAAGDEDELRAERKLEQRKAPKPSSAYSWVVGIAFLILIIVVGLNSLPNAGEGLKGPKPGTVMPAFAAPLPDGTRQFDVNIKTNNKQPGKTYACTVHVPGALNGCELRKKPSVIVFVGSRGANCLPGLDRIERVRRSLPNVAFAGILIKMGLGDAKKTVGEHHWGFPVAYDHDGLLTNTFGIGVCPSYVLSSKGGVVKKTILGRVSDKALRAAIRRLG